MIHTIELINIKRLCIAPSPIHYSELVNPKQSFLSYELLKCLIHSSESVDYKWLSLFYVCQLQVCFIPLNQLILNDTLAHI